MRVATSAVLAFVLMLSSAAAAAAAAPAKDPLPSWNEGPSKKAIVDFVARVTTDGSPDFVKPAERIAVFDNDGTLWCEQPVYFQFAFAIDRIKAMAGGHPEWKEKEPFKSVLAGDVRGVLSGGEKSVVELLAATHAGMSTDAFNASVKEWLKTARHPKYHRPYNELVYQPMLELLAYLRANGFKTFIVSGGGAEFMRAFAEETYGIPPEQVIGSSGVVKFEMKDGTPPKPLLMKEPKVEFIDDGPGKPVGINRFIGRRPVMAFGNSDGDLQMLQYTTAAAGGPADGGPADGGNNNIPRFALIVHHTDGEREVAYDRQSHIGKLDKALDEAAARGWTVVDMRKDWKVVFPAADRASETEQPAPGK
jgi:phosphoglycolate phosphatase-like HAD superfamily hydrolase